MVALAAARNTPERNGFAFDREFPLAAAAKVFQGGMVQINAAGFAVAASATVANVLVGRASANVDNTLGAAGALTVRVRRGVHRFANSAAGDLIARTEIGKNVFVVDDQTVAKTDSAATRPIAGRVYDVDAVGVWVEIL